MNKIPIARQTPLVAACGMLLALALVGGCAHAGSEGWMMGDLGSPKEEKPPPDESNIVAIHKIFSQYPWLIFNNDGTGRIDGVKCTVYLESAKKPKGVFGDGTILITMFRIDKDALDRNISTQVYEWEFPPEAAAPWRSTVKKGMGWGYGFHLRWPSEIDVAGKRVAFSFKYYRSDGRVVSSRLKHFRVPVRDGAPAPIS